MVNYAAELAASRARQEEKKRLLLVEAEQELKAWEDSKQIPGSDRSTKGVSKKLRLERRRKRKYKRKHREQIRERDRLADQLKRENGTYQLKLAKDKKWRENNKDRLRRLQANHRKKKREQYRKNDRERYARLQAAKGKTVRPYRRGDDDYVYGATKKKASV
jgi:hypothetical protein